MLRVLKCRFFNTLFFTELKMKREYFLKILDQNLDYLEFGSQLKIKSSRARQKLGSPSIPIRLRAGSTHFLGKKITITSKILEIVATKIITLESMKFFQ